jgi:hypothetical protein
MYSTWAGERRTRGEAYRTMALTYGTGGGTAGASAAPGNGVAATEGGGGTAEAASEANGRCDDDVGSGTSAARSQQDVDAHARTQLAEAVTVLLSGLGEAHVSPPGHFHLFLSVRVARGGGADRELRGERVGCLQARREHLRDARKLGQPHHL